MVKETKNKQELKFVIPRSKQRLVRNNLCLGNLFVKIKLKNIFIKFIYVKKNKRKEFINRLRKKYIDI